jgi:hypothetical protein
VSWGYDIHLADFMAVLPGYAIRLIDVGALKMTSPELRYVSTCDVLMEKQNFCSGCAYGVQTRRLSALEILARG